MTKHRQKRLRFARFCGWAFLFISAGWYAYDTVIDQLPNGSPSDFAIYRLAAVRIVHGQSPYTEPGYIYPPLLAYLLSPFACIDYLPGRWIWFGLSHAMILMAAYLIWRRLGGGLRSACIVAFVWGGGRAAGESLSLGQVNPALALLLAIAYMTPSTASGLAVGVAAAVKIIPGVTEISWLLARSWKPPAIGLAAAATLVLAPWLATAAFLRGPSGPPNGAFLVGSPAVLNWSLPAGVLRAMDPQPLHGPVPRSWTNTFNLQDVRPSPAQRAAGLTVAALVFGGGLVGLVLFVRGRLSAAQLPLAMAALVTLTLVASPISWANYQTMQYPGIALLLGRLAASSRWRKFAIATVLAAFLYPIPVEVLRILYHRHGTWPDSAVTMYFWTSTAAVAGLGLYWLMVAELKSESRALATSSQSS